MDLEQQAQTSSSISENAFKDQLRTAAPHLRAFARSLCGSPEMADDLVQEAMLKAWAARARFEAGTNFKAWTFTILRNHYFSLARRKRFVGDWNELTAERVLCAPANQGMTIELADCLRALQQIPAAQREALILVGAGGMSYEEVAAITQVALGTVKSRVARARAALEAIMESGQLDQKRADRSDVGNPVVSIFGYLQAIQMRYGSSLETFAIAA